MVEHQGSQSNRNQTRFLEEADRPIQGAGPLRFRGGGGALAEQPPCPLSSVEVGVARARTVEPVDKCHLELLYAVLSGFCVPAPSFLCTGAVTLCTGAVTLCTGAVTLCTGAVTLPGRW